MMNSMNAAATGMSAQLKQMEVISNNLANADTVGFKASRAEFQDLLYQKDKSPGAATSANTQNPTGVQIGGGTRVVATQRTHSQGSLKQTNREFDLAIDGDGFFAVQKGDGEVAYTRDGSLRMGNSRRLETADGFPLVPEIIVPQETQNVVISADGRVQAKMYNAQGVTFEEIGQIQINAFPNAAGLEQTGGNLYVVTTSSGAPTPVTPGEPGTGRVFQGYLESSNVNAVTEMTDLIKAQRTYELNSKVISTTDQMMNTLGQVR